MVRPNLVNSSSNNFSIFSQFRYTFTEEDIVISIANLNDAGLSTARVFSSLTLIGTSKWNRILDKNTRVKDFLIDPIKDTSQNKIKKDVENTWRFKTSLPAGTDGFES